MVWTVLGFCGLILVAQRLPAILMRIGAAKSLQARRREDAPDKPWLTTHRGTCASSKPRQPGLFCLACGQKT